MLRMRTYGFGSEKSVLGHGEVEVVEVGCTKELLNLALEKCEQLKAERSGLFISRGILFDY